MKNVIILTSFLFVFQCAIAQSTKSVASNYVFVMFDSLGSTVSMIGQSYYFPFYSKVKVIMLCDSSLSKAINNVLIDNYEFSNNLESK